QHVVVTLAPLDPEVAPRQGHGDDPAGAPGACRADRDGAGSGPAGAGEAGAPLPGADHQMLRRPDGGERDVGPLWKDRVVLEQWSDPGEVIARRILDPEDRMRIA